jgi:hypothetical protein
LLEIEVAGRLARAGLKPVFAEPDVRVRIMGRDLGVPCKRPRSVKRIADALRDARGQVKRSGGGPAVTVLGIEAIIQPANAEAEDVPLWTVGTAYPTMATFYAAAELARTTAMEEARREIESHRHEEGMVGVYVWAFAAAKIISPPSYGARWLSVSLPGATDEASNLCHEFADALHAGSNR